MKLLFIDSCIRGPLVSRTHQLCQWFLDEIKKEHPQVEIELLDLREENIMPLSADELEKRDAFCDAKKWDEPMFAYAKQFAAADYVVIGAPFWDFSFPAILKCYAERICVRDLTFGYHGTDCVGLTNIKKMMYISSMGGYLDEHHLGKYYLRDISKMLGVHDFGFYLLEGLDIMGADVNHMMEIAKKDLEKMAHADVHAYMEKHKHLFGIGL